MTSIEALAGTLRVVAKPGMTRKELVASVQERHPDAKKRRIAKAALHALTNLGGNAMPKGKHRGAKKKGRPEAEAQFAAYPSP